MVEKETTEWTLKYFSKKKNASLFNDIHRPKRSAFEITNQIRQFGSYDLHYFSNVGMICKIKVFCFLVDKLVKLISTNKDSLNKYMK
jgi:hypothetical protein